MNDEEKRGQSPFVRSTLRAVPANGDCPLFSSDFWTLLDAACADELSTAQWAELQAHLERNPAARQAYIAHIRLRTNIRQWWKGERAREAGLERIKAECLIEKQTDGVLELGEFGDLGFGIGGSEFGVGGSGFGDRDLQIPNPKFQIPNQPILSLSPLPSPLSPLAVGGPVFSYIAAMLILGVMLLGAWAYTITRDYGPSFAQNSSHAKNSRGSTTPGLSTPKLPDPVFVGRVTGMSGCRWADPATETFAGAYVPLGRKYVLASGLMEITYRNGAKVILEGPCRYEVESSAGGFLVLGKLTARVESRETRGLAASAASMKPHAVQLQAPSPKPQAPRPKTEIFKSPNLQISKFSIRTPTAVVTDLGTEFGVEVSESGRTISRVFEGSVRVQISGLGAAAAAGADADVEIILGVNESAVVEMEQGKQTIRRHAAATGPFVRRMPRVLRSVPIELFNTGFGLQEGDNDPHWQITAVGGDPDFKPRQAVVSATPPYNRWLWNQPRRAQWISLSTTENGPADLPAGTYTYRTTFQLRGVDPSAVAIKGAFLADNHVEAIRINGRSAAVPEHGFDIPIDEPVEFVVSEGFVEGENVLEFDVLNGGGSIPNPDSPSPTGLRVEFMGVTRASPSAPHTDSQLSKGGLKTKEP